MGRVVRERGVFMEDELKEPVLRRVRRLDSIRLDTNDSTYFTKEGYLIDHPVLTTCGIFEYKNPDGSTRRELRLPKYVFDQKSLESYRGKPIIISHKAGEVTKDNVSENEIGTILSAGYQDGNDVRAEIVIHDTDAMKRSGLKELSLGYNLDLVEEPGTYNGEPYDAIQTNITINHLALVATARAGEQARLNIDSSDGDGEKPIEELKGGKLMVREDVTRMDAQEMTLVELEKAINKLIEQFGGEDQSGAAPETPAAPAPAPAKPLPAGGAPSGPETKDSATQPQQIGVPAEGATAGAQAATAGNPAPATPAPAAPAPKKPNPFTKKAPAAPAVPAKAPAGPAPAAAPAGPVQTEEKKDGGDLNPTVAKLVAAVEQLLAAVKGEGETAEPVQTDAKKDYPEGWDPKEVGFDYTEDPTEDPMAGGEGENKDADDAEGEPEEPDAGGEEGEGLETDGADDLSQSRAQRNADSIDEIVNQKIRVIRMGDRLNMDGLEDMSIIDGKKAIINKVLPSMRLDGQSDEYINAAFDMATTMVGTKKDANYQRLQMMGGNSQKTSRADSAEGNSALSARERMIARMDGDQTNEGGNQ